MVYTSISNISAELDGFSLSSSSTPSSSQVEDWISEADSYIDMRTGQIWSSNTVSSEVYDYDGSGSFQVTKTPLLAVSELMIETNGVEGASEAWTSLSEGRTSSEDFYFYNDGQIVFHGGLKPSYGSKNITVSYTYGRSSTPSYITSLATKLVAKRLVLSVLKGQASEGGGDVSVGTVRISDPNSFGLDTVEKLNSEINELFDRIGTFKLYRSSRRWG